jgi:hypothetical protein
MVRVIAFGARPEDWARAAAGAGALWAAGGHAVKFVSLSGGTLPRAGEILGVETEALDGEAGEGVARRLRAWKPDLVLGPRTVAPLVRAAAPGPVFLAYGDGADPTRPDVAVAIDEVIPKKRAVLGGAEPRPGCTAALRASLAQWYGPRRAAFTEFAEAFEISAYGRRPDEDEIRGLFPFLPAEADRLHWRQAP